MRCVLRVVRGFVGERRDLRKGVGMVHLWTELARAGVWGRVQKRKG
jgi:hypothetical protein